MICIKLITFLLFTTYQNTLKIQSQALDCRPQRAKGNFASQKKFNKKRKINVKEFQLLAIRKTAAVFQAA
ncbi:hypothetical protein DW914_06770 [Roseburia inulinivorans]|jgi:hypothetical protein|uniref:Uncharacterized protein n=1 Tax=Roseburia inulinivorans TaxID=360807 RepID=A0A413TY54_9FIRM|nr:hypothetical protein DW914_06770 [Roseburia inulinivorans]